MVRPRSWRRPPSALPSLHTLQLRCLVNLNDAINFPVGVSVMLARIRILSSAVHVHSCNAEELVLGARQSELAASIARTVNGS